MANRKSVIRGDPTRSPGPFGRSSLRVEGQNILSASLDSETAKLIMGSSKGFLQDMTRLPSHGTKPALKSSRRSSSEPQIPSSAPGRRVSFNPNVSELVEGIKGKGMTLCDSDVRRVSLEEEPPSTPSSRTMRPQTPATKTSGAASPLSSHSTATASPAESNDEHLQTE